MRASTTRGFAPRRAVSGLLLTAGLGLSGAAVYLHLTIAAEVRAGACDGCTPWHPLFVVAPLLVGALLLLAGGTRLYRGD